MANCVIIMQKTKICIPFRDSDIIYKSERSNEASNDPRLPVVDAADTKLGCPQTMLDDGDDDDEAAETSDEDSNVPLMVSSSNKKLQKTGHTRKTPPAKVISVLFKHNILIKSFSVFFIFSGKFVYSVTNVQNSLTNEST